MLGLEWKSSDDVMLYGTITRAIAQAATAYRSLAQQPASLRKRSSPGTRHQEPLAGRLGSVERRSVPLRVQGRSGERRRSRLAARADHAQHRQAGESRSRARPRVGAGRALVHQAGTGLAGCGIQRHGSGHQHVCRPCLARRQDAGQFSEHHVQRPRAVSPGVRNGWKGLFGSTIAGSTSAISRRPTRYSTRSDAYWVANVRARSLRRTTAGKWRRTHECVR